MTAHHEPIPMQWTEQTVWVRRIGMHLLEVRQVREAKFNWQVLDCAENRETGHLIERGSEATLDAALAACSMVLIKGTRPSRTATQAKRLTSKSSLNAATRSILPCARTLARHA
jgi:hypothetical protein